MSETVDRTHSDAQSWQSCDPDSNQSLGSGGLVSVVAGLSGPGQGQKPSRANENASFETADRKTVRRPIFARILCNYNTKHAPRRPNTQRHSPHLKHRGHEMPHHGRRLCVGQWHDQGHAGRAACLTVAPAGLLLIAAGKEACERHMPATRHHLTRAITRAHGACPQQ